MKEYNVELTRNEWKLFKAYLNGNGIKYEPSEAYNLIHIVLWCNESDVAKVNNFLGLLANY